MTVYILSPGRCGSGWLSTLFAGCGLRVSHEWYGTADIPDVVSDTSYMWAQETFLGSLSPHDICIVLDRDEKERTASVEKLLGPHDWTHLEKAWVEFKAELKKLPNTAVWIDYKDLFSRATKEQLFQILYYHTGAATGNFQNMYDMLVNMRVTNLKAETEVKNSYFGDSDVSA